MGLASLFRAYKYIVHSVKPKTATVKCTVPNCDREWFLKGGHQGFTLASAESHCRAHWRRYHVEHHHEGLSADCKFCGKIAEEEYLKK